MNAFANKKQTRREQKIALKEWVVGTSCRVCLILFAFVFGFLYLLQTSDVSTKGYEMSDLERSITTLERETRKLDVEISTYRSMHSIQQRLEGIEMVAVDNVEYVSPVGTSIVRK